MEKYKSIRGHMEIGKRAGYDAAVKAVLDARAMGTMGISKELI